MKSNANIMSRELLDRFSEQVTETGCILWTGCTSNGYGVIRAEGVLHRAHAASWELHTGKSAKGMCMLHKCDTPSCINPEHLWAGTHAENARDRDQKDRVAHGRKHYRARLTEDQVRAIRMDTRLQREIAEDYGVRQDHISRIKSGQTRRRG